MNTLQFTRATCLSPIARIAGTFRSHDQEAWRSIGGRVMSGWPGALKTPTKCGLGQSRVPSAPFGGRVGGGRCLSTLSRLPWEPLKKGIYHLINHLIGAGAGIGARYIRARARI
jgi:hypothetical protein